MGGILLKYACHRNLDNPYQTLISTMVKTNSTQKDQYFLRIIDSVREVRSHLVTLRFLSEPLFRNL